MTTRHRRRSVHTEAIAPWVALSVVLLMWWLGASALRWARSGPLMPDLPFGTPADVPRAKPVHEVPREPAVSSGKEEPTISADTAVLGSDLAQLRSRSLAIPVRGVDTKSLVSSFHDARGSNRRHEAIDILAPRGTDVVAVEDGRLAKIFTSAAGGLTLYQYDPTENFVYYYAHLDSYAPGLQEGSMLRKGDVVGTVGTTGNAPKDTPHLHFGISKLDPDKRWWGGTALDPFLIWRDPSSK